MHTLLQKNNFKTLPWFSVKVQWGEEVEGLEVFTFILCVHFLHGFSVRVGVCLYTYICNISFIFWGDGLE